MNENGSKTEFALGAAWMASLNSGAFSAGEDDVGRESVLPWQRGLLSAAPKWTCILVSYSCSTEILPGNGY